MSKPSKRSRPVDPLTRLQTLEQQIPLTAEERAAMLPSPDVIAASLESVMQRVEDQQASEAEARMSTGLAGRDAAVAALEAVRRPRNWPRPASRSCRRPARGCPRAPKWGHISGAMVPSSDEAEPSSGAMTTPSRALMR